MSESSTRILRSRTVPHVTAKHDVEKKVVTEVMKKAELTSDKLEPKLTSKSKKKRFEDEDMFVELKSGTAKKRRVHKEGSVSSVARKASISSMQVKEVLQKGVEELQQKAKSSSKTLEESHQKAEAPQRRQMVSGKKDEDVSFNSSTVARISETDKLTLLERKKTITTTPRSSSKIPSSTRKSPRILAAPNNQINCIIENAKPEADENRVEASSKTIRAKSAETSETSTSRVKKREVLKDVLVDQLPADGSLGKPKQHKVILEKIVCVKTPSMKETFKGRLAWKKKHYKQPVTSTPVPPAKKTKLATPAVNNSALQTSCPFDFDEIPTEEENDYSVCLSPIRKAPRPKNVNEVVVVRKIRAEEGKPFRFNDLLVRYGEHDLNEEGELHVNPDGIKATYGKPKTQIHKVVFTEQPEKKSPKTSKLPKRTKKQGRDHAKKEVVNKEMEKWLEEKNKEFEDVEKTPLLVVKSPSQHQEAEVCSAV